jgi:hypothetical protein
MNGIVANAAEHKIVMGKNGYPHDPPEFVTERAGEIIIDLGVTQVQDSPFPNFLGNGDFRCIKRISLDLFQCRSLLHFIRQGRKIQGFQHKGADFFEAFEPIVLGPGQIKKFFSPSHPYVKKSPLLLVVFFAFR